MFVCLFICFCVRVSTAADLGVDVNLCETEVTVESSVEYLTPCRHSPGSCLRTLIDFLSDAHNSLVREVRRLNRHEDRSAPLLLSCSFLSSITFKVIYPPQFNAENRLLGWRLLYHIWKCLLTFMKLLVFVSVNVFSCHFFYFLKQFILMQKTENWNIFVLAELYFSSVQFSFIYIA